MSRVSVPSNIKKLRGTDQPCRMNKDEPEVKALSGTVPPPAILSERGLEFWDDLSRQLTSIRVMSESDIAGLAMLCEVTADWNEANNKVKELGMVIEDRFGVPQQSPWLMASYKCAEQMRKMLMQFGMTPSSRAGVKAIGKAEKGNTFDQFS